MIQSAVVSGATGFVGNYLVEELLRRNICTYVLVRERSICKLRMNIHPALHIIICDYDKLNTIKDKIFLKDKSVCFNLAWHGITGDLRKDYHVQLKNIEKTLELMEMMSELGCDTFVGASSIMELEARLFLDGDGIEPNEKFIYAVSKMASHYMNKIVSVRKNIRYINAQITNIYGEYGSDSLLLHNTIKRLLKGEKLAFSSGEQYYDCLYVKDVVRGLIYVAEKGYSNSSYYIGSGACRKLKEYLLFIGDIISPGKDIGLGKIDPDGFALPADALNIDKLVRDTGFRSIYPFEKKIVDVIDWYREIL